ncbi:MAG: glycosyltransferase family 2 protein [Desulfovibrionales bacterium]|nr:glycosyltransferase family 2 protein [Desulfovibrionales bacterium]
MQKNIDTISLIIPVYNEEENLRDLYTEVVRAMSGQVWTWELVLVDDGSSDRSLDIIRGLAKEDGRVRYLSFESNCGQSAAFAAGFASAQGDVVITMDADLQNDPADIPAMLQVYVTQDVDMVIGWRVRRQDTVVKRYASRFANWVRNTVSRETVRDTGCSLKVMRTDLVKTIPMFKGMHRFLPTLMKLEGALVAEVPVRHRPRSKGVSKYGIWDRAWSAAYDLLAVRWMQKRHIGYRVRETNIRKGTV